MYLSTLSPCINPFFHQVVYFSTLVSLPRVPRSKREAWWHTGPTRAPSATLSCPPPTLWQSTAVAMTPLCAVATLRKGCLRRWVAYRVFLSLCSVHRQSEDLSALCISYLILCASAILIYFCYVPSYHGDLRSCVLCILAIWGPVCYASWLSEVLSAL